MSNFKFYLFICCVILNFYYNEASRSGRRQTMADSEQQSKGGQEASKQSYKVLVTHPEVPKEALDLLSQVTEVIVCQSLPPNRSEILEKAKGVHALLWGSHEPLNDKVLEAAGPQLKAITTMSAGIDYIDVELLKKHKIPLGHTPVVLNAAVADLGMALMLAAARRLQEGRRKIETSTWENYHINWMWGQDIRNATVGFYGFGNIGQTVAKRLQGFDIAGILYTTRHPIAEDKEKQFNAKKVPFTELIEKSDIIFIAAPLTPETQGAFNATAFQKMKTTAVLVNIARGPIVNQKDLYVALKNNEIFAAGIDVVDQEPLPADDPLLGLPNIIITPHIGSATKRTRTDMAIVAADNILRGLAGEPMFSPAY
uniref:Glyoxylate reductase/hydroxypyruvate reductase n=1 Tax=Glossina brevipalpis TaxID=37001 RepID=A0A1A9WL38_9MUSC